MSALSCVALAIPTTILDAPALVEPEVHHRQAAKLPDLKSSPDAALLALDRELRDYLVESEPIRLALVNALAERDRRSPIMPTALEFRHRDHWMPFIQMLVRKSAADLEKVGIIPPFVVEYLRTKKYPRSGECCTSATYREVNARAREILKADDRWQKAKDRLHAKLVAKYNLDENNRRWAALEDLRDRLSSDIFDAKATTLQGVMVKVRFRKWFGEFDPRLDASDLVDNIAVDIANDLESIATGRAALV